MISGATGYVAGWIVKRLLGEGRTIHAAVRDPADENRLEYLNQLADHSPGSIQYFASDLLEPGSYAAAMRGCELVFHTASPFTIKVANPQKDLIEPAQLGTRNVLMQANETESVQRVVVTSSCAAIYGDNCDLRKATGSMFTEEDWNTTSSLSHQAYSYSKTLAEREAWRIAEAQRRWDLVTINPSLVIGPGINPFATSESFALIKQFGDGTGKLGVPDYGIGVVDVRDVAQAHLQAGWNPAAQGRYIISAHNTSFPALAKVLAEKFGRAYPIPTRTLPKWLVWIVAPFFNEQMTRRIASRNVGFPFQADNRKSVRELGMKYRPLEESLIEMFQQMIDHGIFDER
jgi:dihydroflavonol-4-reductase